MSNTIKPTIAAALLVALGACSGLGSTTSPEIVTQTAVGDNPLGLVVTMNSSGGVTVSGDGITPRDYAERTSNGPITSYESAEGTTYDTAGGTERFTDWVMLGETSSGRGQVRLINSTEPDSRTLVVELERTGRTSVPTTGSTAYAGSYLGQLYQDVPVTGGTVDGVGLDRITGTVTLTASFGGVSTIIGSITDRTGYEDITFESGAITNGAFAGTATGGAGTTMTTQSTTSDGGYSGLFTGSDASEAIGGLSLVHTQDSAILTEIGVFIAEETP